MNLRRRREEGSYSARGSCGRFCRKTLSRRALAMIMKEASDSKDQQLTVRGSFCICLITPLQLGEEKERRVSEEGECGSGDTVERWDLLHIRRGC